MGGGSGREEVGDWGRGTRQRIILTFNAEGGSRGGGEVEVVDGVKKLYNESWRRGK